MLGHVFQIISMSAVAIVGPIKLLAHPTSNGYNMNSVCIYYCYEEKGSLAICIAELSPILLPQFKMLHFRCFSAEFTPNSDLSLEMLCVSVFLIGAILFCWFV